MSNHRSFRYRPAAFDHLEDRAVPSGGMARSQVTAAATATTGASALTPAQLQAALATVGTQINAAYATFATGLRQAEATLINTPATTTTDADLTATSTVATSTVLAQVQTLVNTLASSVSTAAGTLTQGSGDAGLIAAGLTGASPGSLLSRLNTLFNAASSNDGVVQGSLPLLFSAVEGAINGSYNTTSLGGYLAAVGQTTPGMISSVAPFSLTYFATKVNPAYATFAATVRQAELTLPIDTAGTTSPTGTPTTVASTVTMAFTPLVQSVTSGLTRTTGSSYAPQIQDQLTGAAAGSLASQLTALLGAATPTGVIPSYNRSLFYAAVDAAINSSYDSTAINGLLISNAVAAIIPASIGSTGAAIGSEATIGSSVTG